MRSVLITLLGFIAGVALTLFIGARTIDRPTTAASPSVATHAASTPPPADGFADAPIDAWPEDAPSPEQVLYAQPRMVQEAVARLGPRVAGRPNLYLLAFAGDGSEDVFRNEAEYAARAFTRRFGPATHALILENNPASLATRPLASWSNLEIALDGLAHTMDPTHDILLLYITSHGGEDHDLLVDMEPLPLDTIGATDLGDILRTRPFKWKVVVVNACYSGGFVPPLRGPGTLVLTAARADRSSFGCGSDSDITYFGRAWLVDALNHTPDFIGAFKLARTEIRQWERRDKLTPSEPQIDIGSGIAEQLARWRQGISSTPPVPFAPAPPAAVDRTPAR